MTDAEIQRLFVILGGIKPEVGELCFIARRRSGLTLNDIEQALGVSRPTVHDWERHADERIIEFWQDKGFRFPDETLGLDEGFRFPDETLRLAEYVNWLETRIRDLERHAGIPHPEAPSRLLDRK
jgi:hypothetical protein